MAAGAGSCNVLSSPENKGVVCKNVEAHTAKHALVVFGSQRFGSSRINVTGVRMCSGAEVQEKVLS